MSKLEKKMGRVKHKDKRRSVPSGSIPAAPRPKSFTARLEWTETRRCSLDLKAVNVTELEKQVAEALGKIPKLPSMIRNGWLAEYQLKLYNRRTDSMEVADLVRVPHRQHAAHNE